MKARVLVVLAALAAVWPAVAEIEKVPTTQDGTLALRWWPKVTPPKGWRHDREHSVSYAINAMAPAGSSFDEAQTIMYAKAIYKPRDMQVKSVDMLVERDRQKFLARDPSMKIAKAPAIKTADGKALVSMTFTPASSGNWERVSYGEEGDFYIIFAVSSRTEKGYKSALPAYERMVRGYREKP